MKFQFSPLSLFVALTLGGISSNAFLVSSSSKNSNVAFLRTVKSASSSSINVQAESSNNNVDCIIVGGGISGSSLAHNIYYQSSGKVSILLTEARDYLGGNVKSHRTPDGFLYEEGPNSFATQPSIVRIAHELNIDDELVFANERLPPWVYHNKKLHPLPKGEGGKGAKGQLELVFGANGVLKFALTSELLSWPGKIRAGIGAFLGHAPSPSTLSPSDPKYKEETIRDWVERILGEEVFLRCIDPFVSGVYAGDPQSLSMKSALSKINRIERYSYQIEWNKFGAIFYGGLARQFELTKERKADPPKPEWVEFEYGNPGSFREGLSTLPDAIQNELGDRVKLNWKLLSINTNNHNDYKYACTYQTPNGVETINAKTIVSTIPTHALQGSILSNIMPKATSLLNTIRSNIKRKGIYHPPVAAVTVAYPKSSFKDVELPNNFGKLRDLPGFGSLNPRTEGVRTLGTLWSSSLFPGRCPDDYNLLLNYIGGSRDVGITELTDEELVNEVDKGCREVLLKPDAPRPKAVAIKVWPTGIPQYELGHEEIMNQLEQIEKNIDGVWICGNYRTGVAFPDCVTYGYDHAKVVLDYLNHEGEKNVAESAVSPPLVEVNEIANAVIEEDKKDATITEAVEKDEKETEIEVIAKVEVEKKEEIKQEEEKLEI